MEENDGCMPLGTCWKHKRPCERYLSAGKMDCFFTDGLRFGRFFRQR
jgi:hypothetical protein